MSEEDQPGEERLEHGPAGRALSSSAFGNSTAFGFSLTMTGTFGMIASIVGTPTAQEVLLFSLGAAVGIGLLEAVATRGFRAQPVTAASEVRMLGTAMNFASVGAAVAVALALAEAIDAAAAWPICALCSATVYVLMEAAEIWLAEHIQEARGDPHAEEEHEER